MKAIVLARVSTEEQKDAGNSLPAQQARLHNLIDRNPHLLLVKEFIYDESAYKENRKKFAEVIDFIKAQKETVALCCDKVDRLSRDFLTGIVELEKLRREGLVELYFASDAVTRIHKDSTAGELFAFNMMLSGAQYYSNCISDNTKRANEQRRRNGEWNGKTRIGYKNITLENGKKDIVFDLERAHLVKKIFELYATGNYSLTTLWQEITKMGLGNNKGEPLQRTYIQKILKDPFFYGMAKSQKHGLYPHRYEKLVTKELFDQCQDILEGKRKSPTKCASKPFLFKGLLRCKNCGCLLSPEIKKGKFIYYSCTNAKGNCKRVYVPEKELLKPILSVFEQFKSIPDQMHQDIVDELRKTSEVEVEFHKNQIERIRAEYDRTQKKIDNLLDLRLEQSITPEMYDKKLNELKDAQHRLNIEMEEHTNADHEYHTHVSTVISLSKRMGEIFESSEPEEKRSFLAFLLQNPTVSGKTLDFSLVSPFDTVLELAHCTSWCPRRDSNSHDIAIGGF